MDKNTFLLYKIAIAIVRPIFKLLYFYKVNVKSELPKEGPYILCSNHLQLKDPIFLAITHKRHISFMAKQELFVNKIVSGALKSVGAFPVSRGKGDTVAINHAKNVLNNNKVIGIFIEGTRSKTGKLLPPKAGTAWIAQNCNVPIVPVNISCKGGKLPRLFRKVTISYGSILTPEYLGLTEESRGGIINASKLIMKNISELREEAI